jgi:hypothetical protein
MTIQKVNYKIIDNFLSQDDFLNIKERMLGAWIPWAYNSFVSKPESHYRYFPYDFQFTHTFYRDYHSTSNDISIVDPIIKILNPSSIVRIKANLQPRTSEIITHEYHKDHNNFDGKIAIYYVNTNNGYTIFEDGTKIESLENRLLVFHGGTLHAGTTCTDQKVRCLINFMFYQWTSSTI